MSLSREFLDQVRERTSLSGLVGRSVKLKKAGREWRACCPFHSEKTPSFSVVEDKGFYHCHGCHAHGDAFRWLQEREGLRFMEAVEQLAAAAGLEVPAPSPQAAVRAEAANTVRGALEAAQAAFVRQLDEAGAVREYLAARGIGPAEIARFGIGYARGGQGGGGGTLKGLGLGRKLLLAAGLLAPREPDGFREVFFDRITFPVHDARGNLAGFAGRVWPGRHGDSPKFINSGAGLLFDKGATLFNLAAASAAARLRNEGRLLVVEGYCDVVALAKAGIIGVVSPMGTALTESQMLRCWRLHHRPVLLFDGDPAGRRAALRAATLALPFLAPGHEMAIAVLPAGRDPDDLVQAGDVAAIEAAIAAARPAEDVLFDAVLAGAA